MIPVCLTKHRLQPRRHTTGLSSCTCLIFHNLGAKPMLRHDSACGFFLVPCLELASKLSIQDVFSRVRVADSAEHGLNRHHATRWLNLAAVRHVISYYACTATRCTSLLGSNISTASTGCIENAGSFVTNVSLLAQAGVRQTGSDSGSGANLHNAFAMTGHR